MTARLATVEDLDGVTETLWQAFRADPVWHWVFVDDEGLRTWWRFYVESALRYPWVWVTDDLAAATVWIPPHGTELTDEQEQRVEGLIGELVGPRTPAVLELLGRFEACHPQDRPHYYLSLFGTRPEHRGRGIGQQLLEANLALIDAEGASVYLESSNPINDRRYERLGFKPHGQFSTPDDSHVVTTMWREGRSA